MHKLLLTAVIAFSFFNYSSAQYTRHLCQTQNVVTVENAFRINDVLVIFAQTNGKSYPIKVKDFKFNTQDKSISIGSVQVWNDWYAQKGSAQVDKMPAIHSTFRFLFPDKRSPLIIVTYDESVKTFDLFTFQIFSMSQTFRIKVRNI